MLAIKRQDPSGMVAPRGMYKRIVCPPNTDIPELGMGYGHKTFVSFKEVFASCVANDTIKILAKIKLKQGSCLDLVTE